jgi:mono/diheme cytochrome c family protein
MSRTRIVTVVPAISQTLLLGVAAVAFLCAPAQVRAQQPSDASWTAPERAAERANPIEASSDALSRGRSVFIQNCASCHGKSGHGDGPQGKSLSKHPADLTSEKVQSQSDGSLFWKITQGRGEMPTTQNSLRDQERWSVIVYVRSLAPKATVAAGSR